MNIQDLHQIKDFVGLFDDPRFQALIQYRRQHISKAPYQTGSHAEAIIHTGGFKEGWLDCLNSFDELKTQPTGSAPRSERLYASRPVS